VYLGLTRAGGFPEATLQHPSIDGLNMVAAFPV
jgi:hypothetical protein